MPRCRGGTDELENLLLSCRNCNQDKGPLGLDQYRALWVHRLNAKSLQSRRMIGIKYYKFFGERPRREMKVRIKTALETFFILDDQAMTWEQVERNPNRGFTKICGGKMYDVPEIQIGKRCIILQGDGSASLSTSEVVAAEKIDEKAEFPLLASTTFGTLVHQ